MADEFIGLDSLIETDPLEVAQEGKDYVASKIPGWEDRPGQQDSILIEASAQEAAVDRQLASETSTAVFRRLGQIHGVPPLDPTAAAVTSTWTMADNLGHTIPLGTQVALSAPDGTKIGFKTTNEVVVPNGQTVTAAGAVTLEAVETGAHTSGLSGAVELIDQLAFVASIAVVGVTTGGTDGETDSAYRDRFSERLRLQSIGLVLPRDFEIIARDVSPVARAVAVDGYKADTQQTGQERCVSVAVVDAAGEPVPSGTKTSVDALFQAQRETTFLAFVLDPTYTLVDVTVTVVHMPGAVAATVDAAVEAALSSYLNPGNWGLPTSGDDANDWINRTTVRFHELTHVVNRVEGVDYITALTFGKQQQATAAAATNLVTLNGHGFVLNDPVVFRALTGGAGLSVGTTYFARDILTNTFGLATTPGGGQIDITTDATAATLTSLRTSDVTLTGVVTLTRSGVLAATVSAP